jgi:hypothetical protein
MNQPYSENFLAFTVLLFMASLAGLGICLAIALKRLITGPMHRAIQARWARHVARTIAARTDFDTALAKLTKENGR